MGDLRRQVTSLQQGNYRDLQEAETRLPDSVRGVQQQLEVLTVAQGRMKEALQQMEARGPIKERMEQLYREEARLEGLLHAMYVALVDGLTAEKTELKDRFHVLEKALNYL